MEVVFVTLESVLVIFLVVVVCRIEEMTFSNPLRCNTEVEDVGVAVLVDTLVVGLVDVDLAVDFVVFFVVIVGVEVDL